MINEPDYDTIIIVECDGVVMARECRDFGSPEDGLGRYTIYVEFEKVGVEEIDVDARNEQYAKDVGKQVLARDYQPGGKILHIEQRFGLYM